MCNFAPFLTIFDKSYRAVQKFELFNFSTFSKNSFARTFSHPTLIIPESFTQIGPAISESINLKQLHSPPLHTSITKSSLRSLLIKSYHGPTSNVYNAIAISTMAWIGSHWFHNDNPLLPFYDDLTVIIVAAISKAVGVPCHVCCCDF